MSALLVSRGFLAAVTAAALLLAPLAFTAEAVASGGLGRGASVCFVFLRVTEEPKRRAILWGDAVTHILLSRALCEQKAAAHVVCRMGPP
ncbi:hypothetical protein STCU_10082 [Strigomonas culicis]|uniref:Uncharacterized protein n=1 Tax=Strigomonas culicis TaxID=28005 RepID=S9V5V0_9TRYP|nr:hypothetical protein STCU_10082 [Strigomonas culicis]|eukprot:EPY18280.1 hypothetical protein STCU_10082 [Strigomonas culicis]